MATSRGADCVQYQLSPAMATMHSSDGVHTLDWLCLLLVLPIFQIEFFSLPYEFCDIISFHFPPKKFFYSLNYSPLVSIS
jgi:hypothetical protein